MSLLNPTPLMYELTTTPKIERLKEVYVKLAEAETAATAASPEALAAVLPARLELGKQIAVATTEHLLAERKNV